MTYNWIDNPTKPGIAKFLPEVLNECLMHLKYSNGYEDNDYKFVIDYSTGVAKANNTVYQASEDVTVVWASNNYVNNGGFWVSFDAVNWIKVGRSNAQYSVGQSSHVEVPEGMYYKATSVTFMTEFKNKKILLED